MGPTNWYAIQVLTGSEHAICNNIKNVLDENLYHQCFVPMSERQHRREGKFITIREPLFPGYLFVTSDTIEEVASALWKISKFKRILRTGDSFSPINESEAKVLQSLTDKDFNITLSKGFIEGDSITVTEGPLKGYEGWIKKIDRHKRMAYVEIPFLGLGTRVRIPLEIVDKR